MRKIDIRLVNEGITLQVSTPLVLDIQNHAGLSDKEYFDHHGYSCIQEFIMLEALKTEDREPSVRVLHFETYQAFILELMHEPNVLKLLETYGL